MRSPMPKAQRGTPGGDKEYRDAVRNSRSPPHASTFNINMPERVNHPPNAPRNRDTSPKTNESWCAWCTEHGLAHNHSTAHCSMLKNANPNDQWKNKHQPTQAPADNLALNVSLAFRDTRYSHTRLAERAPYYSAIPNLDIQSKD